MNSRQVLSRIILVIILLTLLSVSAVAFQFSARINGTNSARESYLEQQNPNTNHGAETSFIVGCSNAGNRRDRGILFFNVSRIIPSGVRIDNATVLLFYERDVNAVATTFVYALHKVQQSPARAWDQSAVTWNNYVTGTPWTTAGGDFAAGPDSINASFSNTRLRTWISWNVTSDVQGFLDTPSTNFGWILNTTAEYTTSDRRAFTSSDNTTTAGYQPQLRINYTDISAPAVSSVTPQSGQYRNNTVVPIRCNVTDNIAVDKVYANVTRPDGSIVRVTLVSITQTSFEGNYTPTIAGITNITLVANDTSGNLNATYTGQFNVTGGIKLTVNYPVAGTIVHVNDTPVLNLSVDADVVVTTVTANITEPDGTNQLYALAQGNGGWTASYPDIVLAGRYNITFVMNDGTADRTAVATYFTRQPLDVLDVLDQNGNALNFTRTVLNNRTGLIDLLVNLTGTVKSVLLHNYSQASGKSVLRIRSGSNDWAGLLINAYGVDLGDFNATHADVRVNSIGTVLWKCPDYTIASGACADQQNYTVLRENLVPGADYTFTLFPGDPGFGETITGTDNMTDSYLRQQGATTNYGAATQIIVGTSNLAARRNRGMIWFNISKIVPYAGIRIDNATLELYYEQNVDGAAGNIVHMLNRIQQSPARNWNESTVTWNNWNSTGAWTTAGGDIVAAQSANATTTATAGVWIKFNVTADAQNFVDTSSTNFGWLINSTSEETTNTRRAYSSSESATAARVPRLIINWTDISPPNVTNVLPQGLTYNVTANVTIRANVTDNVRVDKVFANVTMANGSVALVSLVNVSATSWQGNFSQTSGSGVYYIRVLANDTSGLLNYTGEGNFTINGTGLLITNVNATAITTSSTVIVWNTSTAANSTVRYGATLALASNVTNATLSAGHSMPLTGLVNNTLYYYNVTSCNAALCVTSGPYNFTTLQFVPLPAPSVTYLSLNETLLPLNGTAVLFATVFDSNYSISAVVANVTRPDSFTFVIPLQYNNLSSRYEGTYNLTRLLGTYNVRIIATNTVGGVNDTQITTFKVTQPNMTSFKLDNPDPVQVGQQLNYTINYTTRPSIEGKVLLDFQPFRFITNDSIAKNSPGMIETDQGTLIIAYYASPGTNDDIYVIRSVDGGKTWGSPIRVTVQLENDNYPTIFQDSFGNIIIVYLNEQQPGYPDVFLVKSTDDGLTWSSPSAVTSTFNVAEDEPIIVQDDKDNYYVVYSKAASGNQQIFVTNSTSFQGGPTAWSTPVQLTNATYMNVDPNMVYYNNTFYLAWAPAYPQYQQIWFVNTTNILQPLLFDSQKLQVVNNSIYNYETSINIDNNGNIYIGWVGMLNVSEGGFPNTQRTSNEVFLATSFDHGKNWDVRQVTNNNVSDSYPGIIQTSADQLYFISALRPPTPSSNFEITLAQRVYSPADAVNVTVVDAVPSGVIVQNISNDGTLQNGVITWHFLVQYAGISSTLGYTAIVNRTLKNLTYVTNFANLTYYDLLGRYIDTIVMNQTTTILDTIPPSVTQLVPVAGTFVNQNLNVTLSANVTDNALIDKVFVNITGPVIGTITRQMTYNATTGFYEFLFTNTGSVGTYSFLIIANDTNSNINNTISSSFNVGNHNATIPTSLICNGGSCNQTVNGSVRLACNGSVDSEGDALTYFIQATYNRSVVAPLNQINAGFTTGNDSFVFAPDAYGTAHAAEAQGLWDTTANCTSGGCERVRLNYVTPATGNFSGSWNRSFTVIDHPDRAFVQFDYRLRISDTAGALDSVSLAMRNLSDTNFYLYTTLAGTPGTTGFDDYANGHYAAYVPMWAGTFAFDVGCILTVDAINKNGDCWIDNVNITTINTTYQDVAIIPIGNHSAGSSLNWSIIDFPRQTGINLSCYAVDNGSFLPSNTYYPRVNLSFGDVQKPRVFTPIPTPGSVFAPNVTIEVGVTATDNTGIDKAIANITYPNGASTLVPLTYMPQYDKYNASFITPIGNNGIYAVVFIINDTSNNVNSSTTTWFQVNDTQPPSVFDPRPIAGTNYNQSLVIEIGANVTDNAAVSKVWANITLPDASTVLVQLVYVAGNRYNASYTTPVILGTYNVTFFANDTSGLINSTTTTHFNVIGGPLQVAALSPPSGTSFAFNSTVNLTINTTSSVSALTGIAHITLPDATVLNVTLTKSGSIFYGDFSYLDQDGTYNVTFVVNEGIGNTVETSTWFTRPLTTLLEVVDGNNQHISFNATAFNNRSSLIDLVITSPQFSGEVVFFNHSQRSHSDLLRISNVTKEQPWLGSNAWAIDTSGVNSTHAIITRTAVANNLFKCTQWNWTQGQCADFENYTLIRTDLVPGQNYTITLYPGDPGFYETINGDNMTDSYMSQQNPTTNYGAVTQIIVGTANNANRRNRGIIWFNISKVVPSVGVRIDNATLELYYETNTDGAAGSIVHGLYRVQQSPARNWNESRVTWQMWNTTGTWTTAGGDFAALQSANATTTATTGVWIKFNVTADVQNFINTPSTNFGWVINSTSEATTSARRAYSSSESVTASQRPVLRINYTDIQAPAITLLIPASGVNATTTYYNFSWLTTDNLNRTMACNLTINSAVNKSFVSSANNTPANWTVNAFGSGRYYWNVSCFDGTNWNTSETRVFVVDNAGPWLDNRTESPISPAPYGTLSADLSVNASDTLNAVDKVWLYINSTRYAATLVGGRYNVTVAGLVPGTYYYNWSANDTLGNINTSRIFQYNISSYFFVPVLSFTLTLPGQGAVIANSSQNGTTATMFFNSSTNTASNKEPCVQGTSFCQTGSTPFFSYMNTGTLNLTMSIFLDSALPAVFQLKANVTNASINASLVTTSPMIIARNMTPNVTQPLWFYGNFINAFPSDNTIRNLTSEGTG